MGSVEKVVDEVAVCLRAKPNLFVAFWLPAFLPSLH